LGAGRERGTWQAYGGAESDFRPERWKGFREDYGFTGKESDVEVGLVYFGKRFLSTSLNRWVSADPLAVHGLGADLNVYAYVSGTALRSTDPQGLDLADFVRGMAAEAKESIVAAAKEMHSSAKADAAAIQAGTKSWSDVAKQQGTEIAKAAVGVKLVESAASTVKRVAKAPGQVSRALKAGSDYEAGRRALRPTLTAMEVAAAAGGARVGATGPAGAKAVSARPTIRAVVSAFIDDTSGALRRPYLRKATREAIEVRAPRDVAGRPIDPNTGKAIEGKPDTGHKTGHEFRREKAAAEAEGLTQRGFNDRMNNPDLYQLEDRSSNRSHKHEKKP